MVGWLLACFLVLLRLILTLVDDESSYLFGNTAVDCSFSDLDAHVHVDVDLENGDNNVDSDVGC